jgi:hypothetical protein
MGQLSLRQEAVDIALRGESSLEEVLTVTHSDEELDPAGAGAEGDRSAA